MVVGGGGGGGRPPSLVWPPRLRLQGRGPSPGSSWAAAGAWAVGGQRTSSHTQLLWGIKQSFGLLTPPPSRDGSAKHSDGSSAAGECVSCGPRGCPRSLRIPSPRKCSEERAERSTLA